MDFEKIDVQKNMSFLDYWYIILQHAKFIIITSMLFFIFSFVNAFFILTPDYISKADVMVQVEVDSSATNPNFDLVNAFRLIDTIAELMEKEVVIENAINRLEKLNYTNLSIDLIREGLTVSSSSSSYFINVSFVDQNQALAQDSVDAVIEAVIEVTDVADAFPVLTNKIRRTSYASDAVYYSPNRLIFSLLGLLIGLAASTGFVLIREALSTEFKSNEEIENLLNLQVLGAIPEMDGKEINNGKK